MGRRRKDRELYWRGILQQQAESGLGVAIFCRQASVSAPSFYAWRRKLKERGVAPRQEDVAPHQENPPVNAKAISAAQLLPVHIESSAPPAPVRILLPQGVSIETTGTIDVGVLANLLRVLGEAGRC
jgi:hypothetical protein